MRSLNGSEHPDVARDFREASIGSAPELPFGNGKPDAEGPGHLQLLIVKSDQTDKQHHMNTDLHRRFRAAVRLRDLPKSIAALILSVIAFTTPMASAEPVSLEQAMEIFSIREMKSLRGAYLYGSPAVTGEYQGYGFTVVIRRCENDPKFCYSMRLKSCHQTVLDADTALEFANLYNESLEPGAASTASESDGSVLCVRDDLNFEGENTLGMAEVFRWQRLMETYAEHVQDEEKAALSRSLLEPRSSVGGTGP